MFKSLYITSLLLSSEILASATKHALKRTNALGPGSSSSNNSSTTNPLKTCTVIPKGNKTDDVPQIRAAFTKCGTNGHIIFPENHTYWIASKLNPHVSNVDIEWRGHWQFSDDLSAWRNNSYHIAFQNHWAGFVLSGDRIRMNGYGTGGIHGNGDLWYTDDFVKHGSVQPGRPMPFVLWNVTNVTVQHFSIRQPQLWAFNIMNGTYIHVNNLYVNATSSRAPAGKNWVANTDGFDTMDARHVTLENFTYAGGDDCIAIKPRSYDIIVRNVTCYSGNGVTIGSLGQYLEDSSVEDVLISNVTTHKTATAAYIKTWIGIPTPQKSYESAGKPRGGGWGTVKNITFANFTLLAPSRAFSINQDTGNNGKLAGSSKMSVSDVSVSGFAGHTASSSSSSSARPVFDISCSARHPCENITFRGIDVFAGLTEKVKTTTASCEYTAPGAVRGLTCANSENPKKVAWFDVDGS